METLGPLKWVHTDIAPRNGEPNGKGHGGLKNQMDKNMENEAEAGVILCSVGIRAIYYWGLLSRIVILCSPHSPQPTHVKLTGGS